MEWRSEIWRIGNNMIDELYRDREIREYLSYFSKEQLARCMHLSLLYGIRKIKEEGSTINLNSLEELVGQSRIDHSLGAKSKMIAGGSVMKSPKYLRPTTSIPTSYKEKNSHPPKRYSSPSSASVNDKSHRTVPKYLVNIQSKIKYDVQKDLAMHQYRKEILVSPRYNREGNGSLPDLIEVTEPNTCPVESVKHKIQELEIGKIAEKFLNNPLSKILSPR